MMNPPEYTEPLKINWAKECFVGMSLSVIFTIMAHNSGAEGVVEGSIPAQLHQVIEIGGITMAVVCGILGVVMFLRDTLQSLIRNSKVASWHTGWFGQMQTAKLLKILLP